MTVVSGGLSAGFPVAVAQAAAVPALATGVLHAALGLIEPPHLPAVTVRGLGTFPAIEIHTILVGIHLLGFCFGLGGATMLDFWILRWMRLGRLPSDVVRTFQFLSKVVTAGLILLWISGLGFLLLYTVASPEKLANPKIVAKLTIVVALSLNGLLVHRFMLPQIARSAPLPLLQQESLARRILFAVSGAVSGVSWYSAFALGLLHEFNGRVPAGQILAAWLLCVVGVSAATGAALLIASLLRDPGGGMDARVA